MTTPHAAPPQSPDAQDAPGATLDALRAAGAARLDPARFRYLEALAARSAAQPAPVQRLLQHKLQAAIAAYAARWTAAQQATADEAAALLAAHPAQARELRRLQAAGDLLGMRRVAAHAQAVAACAPLQQLLRTAGPATAAPEDDELASVRRFRRAWAGSRTQQQVEQAAARKPANAGPLNSHVLILDALARMGELSPDYQRRFLVHVQSLQWLERAAQAGAAPARPAKDGKAAAPRRRAPKP